MRAPRAGLLFRLAGAGVGILIACLLMVGARWAGSLVRADPPAPGLTVLVLPSPTASATAPPPPATVPSVAESPVPASPQTKSFAVGALVEVYGTQGEGLRIRESPGLDGTVLRLGLESEVFEILEGPVQRDGLNWWRIAPLYDPVESGWAADLFLRSLES